MCPYKWQYDKIYLPGKAFILKPSKTIVEILISLPKHLIMKMSGTSGRIETLLKQYVNDFFRRRNEISLITECLIFLRTICFSISK